VGLAPHDKRLRKHRDRPRFRETHPKLEVLAGVEALVVSTDFLECRKPEHRGRVRERIMEIDGPIDFVCSEASSFESKNSVVDVAVRSKKREFGI
jgi:hypothetical protein